MCSVSEKEDGDSKLADDDALTPECEVSEATSSLDCRLQQPLGSPEAAMSTRPAPKLRICTNIVQYPRSLESRVFATSLQGVAFFRDTMSLASNSNPSIAREDRPSTPRNSLYKRNRQHAKARST